jgi:hypothetical protein
MLASNCNILLNLCMAQCSMALTVLFCKSLELLQRWGCSKGGFSLADLSQNERDQSTTGSNHVDTLIIKLETLCNLLLSLKRDTTPQCGRESFRLKDEFSRCGERGGSVVGELISTRPTFRPTKRLDKPSKSRKLQNW